MTTVPTAPVPFFQDTRTLGEKLACTKLQYRPHRHDEDCPSEIFGLVLERGQYTSDYDGQEPRETAQILTAENVQWSVVAFHGFLQSEFKRKKPRVGDFVAIAYRGTVPAKRPGENDAHDYVLEVERNPNPPEPQASVEAPATDGSEPETEGGPDDDLPF